MIRTRAETFLVQLKQGSVVFAKGDHPPKDRRLGEILVREGAIGQDELNDFLKRRPVRSCLLGRSLVREGLISEEALQMALI